MTEQNMNNECEQFGELISGLIDGELNVSETEKVTLHLNRCEVCRITQAHFEMVDQAIQSPQGLAPSKQDSSLPVATKPTPPRRSVREDNRNLFRRRLWMPVSLTSAAMVVLALSILWPTEEAGAETTDVQLPTLELHKLEQINQDTRETADETLRTIELQLRMMRVDAKHLDSSNENEARLQSEIDRLLTAVTQLQTE